MHKISSKQIFTFSFILSCFMFPGFGNTLILASGRNSSIISSIIGLILGLIPLFMILSIAKQTNNKNIFELNIERFKIFGHVLNILLILSIIYMLITSMWSMTNFIVSQFLIRTPYYYVLFAMCLIGSIAIIKGLEVISRTSIILFIFFFITIIFAWIFLIPNLNLYNLYPIIDVTKQDLLKTIFMFPSFASLPLIALLFIRKKDIVDKDKYNKKVLYGYLLGSLFVVLFFFMMISTFGIDLSIIFGYPEYTLFKKINAFKFIQRIENIISITIFIASFISFCLLVSFIIEWIKNTFKIKDKEKIKINIIIVLISFIIPFVSTYLFINSNILFIYTRYSTYSIGIFILLLIEWILLSLTKKKLSKKS